MAFAEGIFHEYRVLRTIHLGGFATNLRQNTTFLYDGKVVQYEGQNFAVPQLVALLGESYVPVEDTSSTYQTKPADVRLHSPDTHGEDRGQAMRVEAASDEEREVGTLQDARDRREAASNQQVARATQQPQPQQPQPLQVQQPMAPSLGPTQRSVPVPRNVEEADAINQAALQEALAKPFKKVPLDQMGGNRYDSMSDAPVKAGAGKKFTVEAADGQQGAAIRPIAHSSGAIVGSEGANKDAPGINVGRTTVASLMAKQAPVGGPAPTGAQVVPDQAVNVVAPPVVKTAGTQIPAEGNTSITDMPGGATGDVAVSTAGDDLTDLLPGAAVAGTTGPVSGQKVDLVALKEGWDKKRHWRTRVADALSYADCPGAVETICEVESPGVVKNIKSGLGKL